MAIIKTHRELAAHVKGKSILHLNSLGKDSAVCLEWLHNYAQPSRIVSVNFEFLAKHPMDDIYLRYQKKRYPKAQFVKEITPLEINRIIYRIFQSPIDSLGWINENFEYYDIDWKTYSEEVRQKYGCDFICVGHSRYESMTRASMFHKKGIAQDKMIYPIGMMSKAEIIGVIKASGLKLHPVYKFSESSLDTPSYYKMRSSFVAYPEYYDNILGIYPLLALDKYRYERLLKTKKN